MNTPFDRYGDGTVYRGMQSKDSTVETIYMTAHEYKTLWYAATAEIERLQDLLYKANVLLYKPPADATMPLYTETQLRAEIERRDAVLRMALETMKEAQDLFSCVETCSRNNFVNLASEQVDCLTSQIKAIQEVLNEP